MLKHRLLYGILMAVFFTAIVLFDGLLDGSLTEAAPDKAIQATLLLILISILISVGQLEFSRLAEAKNLKIFTPVAMVASILFAGTWYWRQFIDIPPVMYMAILSAFSLMGLVLYQYFRYGTLGVIANCGANYFSIIYLGLFSAFVPGIRIDFGLWPLVMFIFVIKSSDIGAYAIGSSFGKHKFSPKISPGKTWEGMAGALATAVIVSLLFAITCDIMSLWQAVIFGISFAFIGQGGDLVESMMKRDASQKDASNNVPGFGGILDIVDSALFAAPWAYLFFKISALI